MYFITTIKHHTLNWPGWQWYNHYAKSCNHKPPPAPHTTCTQRWTFYSQLTISQNSSINAMPFLPSPCAVVPPILPPSKPRSLLQVPVWPNLFINCTLISSTLLLGTFSHPTLALNVGAVLVAYQPRVPNDKIEIHVVAAPILLESIPGQGYDTLVDLTQLSSLTRTTHLKSSHKYYYSTYSFFTFDSNRPVNQILYYYSFPCSTFSLLLMVFSWMVTISSCWSENNDVNCVKRNVICIICDSTLCTSSNWECWMGVAVIRAEWFYVFCSWG